MVHACGLLPCNLSPHPFTGCGWTRLSALEVVFYIPNFKKNGYLSVAISTGGHPNPCTLAPLWHRNLHTLLNPAPPPLHYTRSG
jgi:hypothetical protein